jgi:hypothetical protein
VIDLITYEAHVTWGPLRLIRSCMVQGVLLGDCSQAWFIYRARGFGTLLPPGSSLPASEDTLLQNHAVPLHVRRVSEGDGGLGHGI